MSNRKGHFVHRTVSACISPVWRLSKDAPQFLMGYADWHPIYSLHDGVAVYEEQ